MSVPPCIEDLVLEIPDFLDKASCQRVIKRADQAGFAEATVNAATGAELQPDIRNNQRVILDDLDLAAKLWSTIAPHCRSMRFGDTAVGLNERFRIYRYHPGHFFDWHQDGIFERDSGESSRFTLLIWLNDAFEGGATSFRAKHSPYDFDDFRIEAEAGKAVVFFHPISHRGDLVTSGAKYMLRSDVMYAPRRARGAS